MVKVPFLGLEISRTTKTMLEEVNQGYSALEKMGYAVVVSREAAARHDEIAELDGFIKSPLTTVPDKIEHMDSLINRSILWGGGRRDAIWGKFFGLWRKGYHHVWLPILGAATPPVTYKYKITYKEKRPNLKDPKGPEILSQPISVQMDADTVLMLQLHPERYLEVKVLEEVKVENREFEEYNPNVDLKEMERQAWDFGREVVLDWGWRTMNLNVLPEHVTPAAAWVIPPGIMAPPGTEKKPENQGGPTP